MKSISKVSSEDFDKNNSNTINKEIILEHNLILRKSTLKIMSKRKKTIKKQNQDEISLQQQIDYLNGLNQEDFDREFEKMMDEMNLSEVLRLPLRKREMISKIDMLSHFNFKASREKNVDTVSHGLNSHTAFGIHTVLDCIRELTRTDINVDYLSATMQSIRVFLTAEPLSVVQSFCKDGLTALLNIMSTYTQHVSSSTTIQKILLESVRCMKAIMNNQMGLKSVLNSPTALILLAKCIRPDCHSMMLDAVRLMAAVFLVSHDKALNCLTVVGQESNIPRFSNVLSGLGASYSSSVKASCLLLVNALVSSPQNLSLRIHLRNELCRNGFLKLHAELTECSTEDIRTQLDIYDENKEDDEVELNNKLRDIQIQFNDAHDLFNILVAITSQTPSAPYFLSILQHLVLIRDDIFTRSAYFKFIEEVVSQIVLRKGCLDPDFMCSKLDIDIESLVDGLVNAKVLEESKAKLGQYEAKLATEATLRSETEAKYSLLESKNKKLEEDIVKTHNEILELNKKLVQISLLVPINGFDASIKVEPVVTPLSPPSPPLLAIEIPPPLPPPLPTIGIPPPPPFGGPPSFGSSPTTSKPIKKKYKAHNNMKRLNWAPLATSKYKQGTIWKELDEESMENPKLFEEITNLFQQKTTASKDVSSFASKDNNKKKIKENRIIDNKTAQNISIFLGSIKLPLNEIRQKILSLDPIINESIIESIIKFLPPLDQLKALAEFSNEFDELTEAEQFLFVLNGIYRLENRLKCLKFLLKFPDELGEVKPQIVTITTACREIKNNIKFKKVIGLVLLYGNYMNAGSKNECSIGFDIKFLSKLADTKSTDGNSNFVNFLSLIIDDYYKESCDFETEMLAVEAASKLNVDMITKSLDQMKGNLEKTRKELTFHKKNCDDKEDLFHDMVTKFCETADEKLILVLEMCKTMINSYDDLVNWLGLDIAIVPVDELFKEIAKFINDFAKARRENMAKREKIEKEQRIKAAKEKEKLEKEVKKVSVSGSDKEEGVIDELLQALETGQFRSKDNKDGARKKKGVSGNITAELRKQRTRTLNKMASIIVSDNSLMFNDNI